MENNETTQTVAPESFTAVIVKSFAASLATTAGMIVALGAVGAVVQRRERRDGETVSTTETTES